MIGTFTDLQSLNLCNELGSQSNTNLRVIQKDLQALQVAMKVLGISNDGLDHSLTLLEITIARIDDLKNVASFHDFGSTDKNKLYAGFLDKES